MQSKALLKAKSTYLSSLTFDDKVLPLVRPPEACLYVCLAPLWMDV